MRILQIVSKFPFPTNDGGSVASISLAQGLLSAGAVIDLYAISSYKHPADQGNISALRKQSIYNDIDVLDINVMPSVFGAIYNFLFGKYSYFVSRFYNIDFENGLLNKITLKPYDVIILDHLNTAVYLDSIKKHTDIPVMLRAHNVEYELRERMYRESSFLKKKILNKEIKRIREFEINSINRVEAVLTVSDRDNQLFSKNHRGSIKIITVPIGIDQQNFLQKKPSDIFKIGFIGSLDWKPNLDGLGWFLREVWCKIAHDKIEFHIAGSHATDFKIPHKKGVIIHGRVASSADFIRDMDLMIVPLWSGSGTRVKILESMSCSTAVLSTSLGAEGIAVGNGLNIWIADKVIDWISKIQSMRKNPEINTAIAKMGYNYVSEHHNTLKIGMILMNKLKKDILKRSLN